VIDDDGVEAVGKLTITSNIEDWRCPECGGGWLGCECGRGLDRVNGDQLVRAR